MPVLAYENGSFIKEAYDPRTVIRNPTLKQPQQVVASAYCYHGNNGSLKQEKTAMENERHFSQTRQTPQCGMATKIAPDIAINIDGYPFYMTRGAGTKVDHGDDRIGIDANLLPAKTQYNRIGVAAAAAAASAAASRKVGAVQFGMSRMY